MQIVYCDTCGLRISDKEFESGRAVTTDERNFCEKCATQADAQHPVVVGAPPRKSELIRMSSSAMSPAQRYGINHGPENNRDNRHAPGTPERKPGLPMLPIAAGIGVLVLAAIGIFAMSGSGKAQPADEIKPGGDRVATASGSGNSRTTVEHRQVTSKPETVAPEETPASTVRAGPNPEKLADDALGKVLKFEGLAADDRAGRIKALDAYVAVHGNTMVSMRAWQMLKTLRDEAERDAHEKATAEKKSVLILPGGSGEPADSRNGTATKVETKVELKVPAPAPEPAPAGAAPVNDIDTPPIVKAAPPAGPKSADAKPAVEDEQESRARQDWAAAESVFSQKHYDAALRAFQNFKSVYGKTKTIGAYEIQLKQRLDAIDMALRFLAPGLCGSYFKSKTFRDADHVLDRIDERIDFNWDNQAPAANVPRVNFCARWAGWIKIEKPGHYTFTTVVDDDARLFIDGRQLINDWTPTGHAAKPVSGAIDLVEGYHELRLEYGQGVGQASLKFLWSLKDGFADTVVPSTALFHHAPPTPSDK